MKTVLSFFSLPAYFPLIQLLKIGQVGEEPNDDVSKEKGLMQSWPSGGPKKLWMSDDAGLGYAGFSVADGVLYTMGALAEQKTHRLSYSF